MTLAPLTSLGLVHRNQSTRRDGPTSLCNQAKQSKEPIPAGITAILKRNLHHDFAFALLESSMNSAREKPGRARLSVLEPALSEVEGCRSESKKATPSAGAGAARVGLTLLSVAFDVAL